MPDLLRICTAGSVDDGKSTLIGRLLYDSRAVYEDQVHSVRVASRNRAAGPIDFSLFTDGLRAEREQGITIDVAYRYFATARRKFILADTPGHEQYTRNMATGASTADVAILLVDARHGVRPQTVRHARIARLLGISTFVLAINKMDLVGFDARVFHGIRDDFSELLDGAGLQAIPISALHGDNVTVPSERTPWFEGPSLLSFLETVEIDRSTTGSAFRLPVQLVIRPDHDFRGYAGQIASGTIRVGDRVTVWPSGLSTRVTGSSRGTASWTSRSRPCRSRSCSPTISMSAAATSWRRARIEVSRRFSANVVWMDERPLDPSRAYILKHASRVVTADVDRSLNLNEIGSVVITTARAPGLRQLRRQPHAGQLRIIDPATNFTAGGGMIASSESEAATATGRTASRRIALAAREATSEAEAEEAVRRIIEEMLT